jgi:Flp pilus assembly pilin Flp
MMNFVNFMLEEDGMGTVEIVLIIVVLIGLVLVFKEGIKGLVSEIVNKVKSDARGVAGISGN